MFLHAGYGTSLENDLITYVIRRSCVVNNRLLAWDWIECLFGGVYDSSLFRDFRRTHLVEGLQ